MALPGAERARIQVIYVPASRDGARQLTAFLREPALARGPVVGRAPRARRRRAPTRSATEFHGEAATGTVEKALVAAVAGAPRRGNALHPAVPADRARRRPVAARHRAAVRARPRRDRPTGAAAQRRAAVAAAHGADDGRARYRDPGGRRQPGRRVRHDLGAPADPDSAGHRGTREQPRPVLPIPHHQPGPPGVRRPPGTGCPGQPFRQCPEPYRPGEHPPLPARHRARHRGGPPDHPAGRRDRGRQVRTRGGPRAPRAVLRPVRRARRGRHRGTGHPRHRAGQGHRRSTRPSSRWSRSEAGTPTTSGSCSPTCTSPSRPCSTSTTAAPTPARPGSATRASAWPKTGSTSSPTWTDSARPRTSPTR